jgi:hypothetical protein
MNESGLRSNFIGKLEIAQEHIPLESIRFERQEYAPAFESGAISGSAG